MRRGRGKGNIDFWYCTVKPGRILFEMKVSHRFQSLVRPALFFALRKLPRYAQVIFKDLMISLLNNLNKRIYNIETPLVTTQTNDSTSQLESNIIDQRGQLALQSSNTNHGDLRGTAGGSNLTPDTITQTNSAISIPQEIIEVSTSVNEAFAVLENTIKANHPDIKEQVIYNYIRDTYSIRERATEVKFFQRRLSIEHFYAVDGKTVIDTHAGLYERYKLKTQLIERKCLKINKTGIENFGEKHYRDPLGDLTINSALPRIPQLKEDSSVLVEFLIKQNSLITNLAKNTNKTAIDIRKQVDLIVPVKASPKFQQEYNKFFQVSSNHRKTAHAKNSDTKRERLPQADLQNRRALNIHEFAQLNVQMDTIPHLVNISFEIANPGEEMSKIINDPITQGSPTLTLDNINPSRELYRYYEELLQSIIDQAFLKDSGSINEAVKGMLRTPEKPLKIIAEHSDAFNEELIQ